MINLVSGDTVHENLFAFQLVLLLGNILKDIIECSLLDIVKPLLNRRIFNDGKRRNRLLRIRSHQHFISKNRSVRGFHYRLVCIVEQVLINHLANHIFHPKLIRIQFLGAGNVSAAAVIFQKSLIGKCIINNLGHIGVLIENNHAGADIDI